MDVLQKYHTFATAYLQGRVKIPIGGIVREPEGHQDRKARAVGITAPTVIPQSGVRCLLLAGRGRSSGLHKTGASRQVSLDERRKGRAGGPVYDIEP